MLLFLFFDYNDTSDWIVLMGVLLINAISFVVTFLSRGFAFYYTKAKINTDLKKFLTVVHIGGSIVLSLAIPNNFLNEYPIINEYYTKNGLWIFASSLLLFFIFVLALGIAFSLVTRLYTTEVEEIK